MGGFAPLFHVVRSWSARLAANVRRSFIQSRNPMAKAKRKTLPTDFELLLERGTMAELKAVFDVCELNARGGYSKETALAFDKCPDDLARWLAAQGADLSATDTWGNTPLHSRARSRRSSIAVTKSSTCNRFPGARFTRAARRWLSKRLPGKRSMTSCGTCWCLRKGPLQPFKER